MNITEEERWDIVTKLRRSYGDDPRSACSAPSRTAKRYTAYLSPRTTAREAQTDARFDFCHLQRRWRAAREGAKYCCDLSMMR